MHATKAFKFDVKASADKAGHFAGRASVYGVVDHHNDVVMPGAFAKHLAEFGNRIKVLNQHNPNDPIGMAELSDSDTALLAEGSLVLDLQSAKDMHTRLVNGLIDAMSIGYEVLDEAYSNGVRQLKAIKLWEISLVTFPANTFARVTDVKSMLFDAHQQERFIQQVAAEVKAGRRISSATESIIRSLAESHKATGSFVEKLVGLLEAPAEEDDAKALLKSLRQLEAGLRGATA